MDEYRQGDAVLGVIAAGQIQIGPVLLRVGVARGEYSKRWTVTSSMRPTRSRVGSTGGASPVDVQPTMASAMIASPTPENSPRGDREITLFCGISSLFQKDSSCSAGEFILRTASVRRAQHHSLAQV